VAAAAEGEVVAGLPPPAAAAEVAAVALRQQVRQAALFLHRRLRK
jgi:hypothetical protein